MARGPSKEQIYRAVYNGLNKLKRRLAKKGIESKYSNWELHISGSLCSKAGYKLLRASNGEAALMPGVQWAENGKWEFEWGVFNSIVRG